MRLGILGCAKIAQDRFLPAAKNIFGLDVVAVAEEYDRGKLNGFCGKFGLEGMDSFDELIGRKDIAAIYVPQPPALHYKWAKRALDAGKHVFVEKPSTTTYSDSEKLVELARSNGLALHENYMFQYHSQLKSIVNIIKNGEIGDVRLYRASFGFPFRSSSDFRYDKTLGGGALLDAGGYTIKLATLLLGKTIRVESARLCGSEDFDVDIYGAAFLSNEDGDVCEVSFGMDCSYKCCLEVWGSKGTLFTNRVFTAPDEYRPTVIIENVNGRKEVELDADSHFQHSIERFMDAVDDEMIRNEEYEEIILQSRLVEKIRKLAER